MTDIVVLGSLNMDLVVRAPHLPAPGETVLGGDLKYVCGGKGGNQAFTLAKIGAKVAMLGSVGHDDNGQKLLNNLYEAGVEVSAVQRLTEAGSGLALIAVEDSGNNNIIVVPGANYLTTPDYVEKNQLLIAGAKALVMQLEVPLKTVTRAATLAKAQGKLVILDPAPAAPLPPELYACVDILKPNEIELGHLTGRPVETVEEAAAAAQNLLEAGVGRVVVTLGPLGAVIVDKTGHRHFPVVDGGPVVDTTAAGDSFTAAMTLMLVNGRPLDQAVRFALAVSRIVVSRPGAQTSIPDADELGHLIKNL